MPADSTKKMFALRATALAALTMALFYGSAAPGYQPILFNGVTPTIWRTGSPTAIWDDTNKIVRWTFYNGNFPKGNWPTIAEAGAAVQNAAQTITDVPGKSFSFQRLADSSTDAPVSRGPNPMLTIAFAPNEKSDFYGTDLTGANAVTYVDDDFGTLQDADIIFNGDPSSHTWKVDGSGSHFVQATGTHELVHACGAAHSPYFNARVFPFARTPVNMLQDSTTAPDDANFLRAVYGNGANGTLTGTVTLGGGAVARAVIVAIDANDVPQAIIATDATGAYNGVRALSVPPGTYTVTAWHGWTSAYLPTYAGQDVDFDPSGGATAFVTASSVNGVVVTAGNNTAVTAITTTAGGVGTPDRFLSQQSLAPTAPEFQSLFVSNNQSDPSHTGTMRFEIDTASQTVDAGGLTAPNITSVSLGAGITAGVPTVGPGSVFSSVIVSVPYTVTAGAAPGMRTFNMVTNFTGNERIFIPGVIKVVGQGGLTIAASAGNPVGGSAGFNAADQPLLGLSFTANGTNPEDVRIQRLVFNLAGAGPSLPSVKLWVDKGTPGQVDGADTRVFSGAAYATGLVETIPGNPPGTVIFDNLALTIPTGTTVNLLVTADTPAAGTGNYTLSLNPIGTTGGDPNVDARGMYWGDIVTVSSTTIAGGPLTTDPLTLTGLEQTRFTGGAVIPTGGSTPENQVVLKGVVTTSAGGTVGMEVEVRPAATAFTNVATQTTAPAAVSGSTISVNVPGLSPDPSSYHWQARALHSTLPAGPWIAFGGNAVTAADFSLDSSTTSVPTGLTQTDKKGVTVPLGMLIKGKIYLNATNGTNTASNVRLEVEVRPNSTAFTGVPTNFSAFVPSGTASTATFSGPSGLYHWQARTTNLYGTSSAWVDFSATTPHFDFKRTGGGGGSGGCGATVAGNGGGFWWALLALGLLAVFGRQRTV